MDNFDKLFNDKLGEITENDFEFKESSWERFQSDWNNENEPARKFVPLVWAKRNVAAAAVILLLLMSNVFFAQQFMSTRTDVKTLTSTIEELREDVVSCQESSEKYTNAVADLETKLEEQALVIEEQAELISNQQNTSNRNRASVLPIFPNQSLNQNLNQNSIVNNSSNDNTNGSIISNNATTNGDLNNNLSNNSNGNSNNLNIPNQSIDVANNSGEVIDNQPLNTKVDKNKSKENQDNSTTNNSTSIVNNSTSNPSILDEKPTSIEELNRLQIVLNDNRSKDINIVKRPIPEVENKYKPDFGTRMYILKEEVKPSVYQLGIQSKYTFMPTFDGLPSMGITNNGAIANALFFNNFRLQIGVNHWFNSFEVDDVETLADGVVTPFIDEFPYVAPNSPLDDLAKVETKIYGFDLPLSAQILLRPNKSFNPYIGFGLRGRYTNNYVQEYYFMDYTSGFEYETKNEGLVQAFNFGIWESQIGMDYNIYKNWMVNFEINYLRSFKEQVFGLPNIQQYGASLGVKYEF